MKALVTGASSGIGKAIARELCERGYDLVLVARNIEKSEAFAAELKTQVQIEIMDISKIENCRRLHEKYREIDLLVNNAGIGACGYFTDIPLERELQMIQTNIAACHTLTKLYLSDMKMKNAGIILNVASIGAFMPGPLLASYYASKAYVKSFSEAVREELKEEKSKVQISILCPGPVNTNFTKKAGGRVLPSGLDSEVVAKYAVKKLFEGKFYIVPGWTIRLVKIGVKLLPTRVSAKLSYMMQKKKM